VYTVTLDPTTVLTPTGRKFLNVVAGPAGDEIANDYEQVLKGIGVIPVGKATLDVVPFVKAQSVTITVDGAPVRLRVDETKLTNLNAYTNSLQSPAPGPFDVTLAARGKTVFAGSGGCTGCHQLDPNKFVPPIVFPIKAMYPGNNPTVVFMRPAPSLPFYDNRLIVPDARREGNVKGFGLPLKVDLARRTALLHDDEIFGVSGTLDEAADIMMNPAARDAKAAHPFFIADATDRRAVVEFMKSLGTSPVTFTTQGIGNLARHA
jgi:hypothetical protein